MAAQRGKDVLIRASVSSVMTTVAGMRTKTLAINSETVDVSDSGSTGEWRELLASAGIKSMTITGAGVFKDTASEAEMVALTLSAALNQTEFVYPGLGTFSGLFQVSQCELSGEYNGEAAYSFTFESAGVITFTGV